MRYTAATLGGSVEEALEKLSASLAARLAQWRLEGFAPNAARMLGLLDATPAFHDVRFLSATNRAVIGTRTYESFSLAFRYTPTP